MEFIINGIMFVVLCFTSVLLISVIYKAVSESISWVTKIVLKEIRDDRKYGDSWPETQLKKAKEKDRQIGLICRHKNSSKNEIECLKQLGRWELSEEEENQYAGVTQPGQEVSK